MQYWLKKLNMNLIKYTVILLTATVLSVITYNIPFFHDKFFLEQAKALAILHKQWMSHSHSFSSWVFSAILLCTIVAGVLISPFIFAILLLLSIAKRDWLPENDPNLIYPLNYWCNLVLLLFLVTYFVQFLEVIGAI